MPQAQGINTICKDIYYETQIMGLLFLNSLNWIYNS